MAPKKSAHFWVEALVIQAEDTLFSIPKYVLELPGTSFNSLLPPSGNEHVSGGDKEDQIPALVEGDGGKDPIRLAQGITALQFTHFLSLLYKQMGDQSTKPSTFEDWMGVYKLASMGHFDAIQSEAESAVKTVMLTKNGLDCIQLGRRYGVGPWIKWGLSLLILKGEELDSKQLREGGLRIETICALYSIRENNLFGALKTKTLINYSLIKGAGFGSHYFVKDEVLRMIDEEVAFSQDFGALDDLDKAGLSLYPHPTVISHPWHTQDGAGDDDDDEDEDMGFGLFD